MPLVLPPSMKRTLLHAGGGAVAGAALGGATANPEHRLRGALQGGAIGGLAAGGGSALASRSAGQRINALKSDVAQGASALRTATEETGALKGQLQAANTRVARLLGQPSSMSMTMPSVQAPPALARMQDAAHAATPMPRFPEQANSQVENVLQKAMSGPPPAPPAAPFQAWASGPVAQTPPVAPFQSWASGPMSQAPTMLAKAAMSPLGGSAVGALGGALISSGASAASGERDPKKLLRNAAGGAVAGGCMGYGIAHAAGQCGHAAGFDAGYERRKAAEPALRDLMQQAGTKILSPLDAIRAQL